jgi:fructosamine-3-kinase
VSATAKAVTRLLGLEVVTVRDVSGGDLSSVAQVTLANGDTLIAKHAIGATAEAGMLRAIAATGAPAPAVYAADEAWLLMEDVPAPGRMAHAWGDLARILGLLHAPQAARYGWPADHAFGPIQIANESSDDWAAFWAERRLRCHLPYLRPELGRRIERLADRLGALLPARPPSSLLHGDLWGGNVLVAADRVAALIDPACYYGDREVDVAMLTLFDRPPPAFFGSLALAEGWRDRQPVYRLWPLLVHLRLFGNSYAGAVDAALLALRF